MVGSLLSRRRLMQRMAFAAGAVAGMPLLRAIEGANTRPGGGAEVIVVGAGLAGLVAAYELEKLGHRVTLLEAEPMHVGGRVRTLRFGDGLYGEAGAMRIPQRHDLTRHYVKAFDLTLRKFVQSNPEGFYCLRGRRERIKDVNKLLPLYDLAPAEKDKTPDDLWGQAVTARLKAMTDLERSDLLCDAPVTAAVRAFDQQSLQQLCEMAGLSQEAIELLLVTYAQETLAGSAATEHLREEYLELWTLEFDEVVGGTDRIATGFVERLKVKPRHGCEVTRIVQDGAAKRVAAVFTEGGKEQRVEGDWLICTLPLPVLGRIDMEPTLSGPKARAIRQLSYDSATKVLAICEKRFWESEDGIFGGGTFTDLPSGATYYPSDNAAARDPKTSAGPGIMLASYTWGQMARRLGALPHAQRSAVVLKNLARVHPQLAKEGVVRQPASWSWDNHPWAGGAFAWFMPGQHTALHRHLVAPEGRVFFAGEHTSLAHTWMQGALESGLRAVRAVAAAAGAA